MYKNLLAEMKRSEPEIYRKDIANLLDVTMRTLQTRLEQGKLTTSDITLIRDTYFPDQSLDYLCENKIAKKPPE